MTRLLMAALMASAVAAGAGCSVVQDQNTRTWQTLEADPATGNEYWIFVPDTYRPETPSRLIVTCHGTWPWDVNEHHIQEWKKLGEDNNCIVVAPRLVGTDGIVGDGPVQEMMQDEEYILSLVSLIGYRYNVDMNNIMITGFSGGGFPTYWVGLRNPDVFSCVVLRSCDFCEYNVDGWFSRDLARSPRRQAILVYWGHFDPAPIKVQSAAGLRLLAENQVHVEEQVVPGISHERRPEWAMDFFLRNQRPTCPSLPVTATVAMPRAALPR